MNSCRAKNQKKAIVWGGTVLLTVSKRCWLSFVSWLRKSRSLRNKAVRNPRKNGQTLTQFLSEAPRLCRRVKYLTKSIRTFGCPQAQPYRLYRIFFYAFCVFTFCVKIWHLLHVVTWVKQFSAQFMYKAVFKKIWSAGCVSGRETGTGWTTPILPCCEH